MEKFTQLRGVAAPLDMVNIDTDLIIPKQHLKASYIHGSRDNKNFSNARQHKRG